MDVEDPTNMQHTLVTGYGLELVDIYYQFRVRMGLHVPPPPRVLGSCARCSGLAHARHAEVFPFDSFARIRFERPDTRRVLVSVASVLDPLQRLLSLLTWPNGQRADK